MAKPILGDDPFEPRSQARREAKKTSPAVAKKPVAAKKAIVVARPKPKVDKAPKAAAKSGKAPKAAPVSKTPKAARTRKDPKTAKTVVAPVVETVAETVNPTVAETVNPTVAETVAETVIPAVAETVHMRETEAAPVLEPAPPSEAAAPVREVPRRPAVSTPPPPPAETASEYGPSIDRPTGLRLRGRAVDAARHLEERLRSMMLAHPAEESRKSPPLELVWKRWRGLAMRDRSAVVDEFGRDPNVAAALDPMLDFLYRSWFRVTTTGVENVPATGRGLIVANHSGSLPYDGGMIMHAVRREHPAGREVRPLVEDFVFHFPYLGTLVNRIGGVRACQENAERLLETDQLVAVFPEGIKGIGKLFSQRYQLQRFGRGGFIKLALASDAPIIPTAVVGAEEIHPMLAKVTWLSKALGIPYLPLTPTFPWLGPIGLLPLPTKWFIAFGEPLDFTAEYGAEAAHDRILVNKLAEQVRQRIQEMIDQLVKSRRSVLFG